MIHSRGRIKLLALIVLIITLRVNGTELVGVDLANNTVTATDGGSTKLPNVTNSPAVVLTTTPVVATTVITTTPPPTITTEEITTEQVMTTTVVETTGRSSTSKEVPTSSSTTSTEKPKLVPEVTTGTSHEQLPNCSAFEVSTLKRVDSSGESMISNRVQSVQAEYFYLGV